MKKFIFLFALFALVASAGVTFADADKSPPGVEYSIFAADMDISYVAVNEEIQTVQTVVLDMPRKANLWTPLSPGRWLSRNHVIVKEANYKNPHTEAQVYFPPKRC